VADLALLDELVERAQGLLERRVGVVGVGVVEVDVVALEALERFGAGSLDVLAGEALTVGLRPTLVARTTSARLPRAANQLPSTVSDSPP
jgi:hypothetical protein